MKQNSWRVILGIVLVVFGALALFQTFTGASYEGAGWGMFMAMLFGAVGAGFVVTFTQDRRANWWAVIPGFTLIGLGLLIALAVLNFKPDELLPAVFMGSIAASFWVIYFNDRSKWWAIIPGGAVASIAVLILMNDSGSWPAVILFGGLAATFGMVAILAGPDEKSRSWAWYPAVSLAVLTLIVGTTAGPLPGIIWPIVLICAGLLLVGWTLYGKKK